MKINKLLLVGFFFLFATTMFAQEIEKKKAKSVLTIDAEFRNRTEYTPGDQRNKLVPENTTSAAFSWQRSRLTVAYKSNKLETKFTFQDVRPFGVNAKIFSKNGATVDIHEAWAKYNFINNDSKKLGLKLGRQVLKNSDSRIIGIRNWNHYGGAIDAFALECDNKDFGVKWNLALSLNSADVPSTAGAKYRSFLLFNLAKKVGDNITINFTDLLLGFDEKDGLANATYSKNYIGINPVFKKSGIKVDGSFYYLHGQDNAIVNGGDVTKYAAMMYTLNASYKINYMITAGLGYDNYSGEAHDDDQTDNKIKQFTAAYGGAHKFFGSTDFQLVLLKKERGLQDINLKVNFKINKKTGLKFEVHNISFANKDVYTDATNGKDIEFTAVGNNVDLILKRSLGKKMSVQVGTSVMLPSADYVKSKFGTTNAKFHSWTWVMFSFKPNLFKHTK